jgi:hypothetical protein
MENGKSFDEKSFRQAVCIAWELIALDCGSVDGEGATDNIEQVFFQVQHASPELDDATLARVGRLDPELVKIAKEELKRYG